MYKMLSFFMNEMCKHIEKTGRVPARPHDDNVFVGQYGPLKMVFCYKGEFFFILPENFQMFDASCYQQGSEFSTMKFRCEHECVLTDKKIFHPYNDKKVLRELVSIHDEAPNIFSKRVDNQTVYYDKAYIQERYAKWFEELSAYYGGMTEVWTDGQGAFTLKRVNGDVIAVTLEVRI